MSGYKLVVTGSRVISTNIEFIYQCLSTATLQYPIAELVSGHALGVDTICEDWAKINSIPIAKNREFYPDWKKYGMAAGKIRNKLMVDYGDLVIGFLDLDVKSNGTRHCLQYAIEKDKLLYFFVRKNGVFQGRTYIKLEDIKK